MNDSKNDLPVSIGNPATNALLAANIITLKQVAELSDKELLALHGVGPKAVRILREQIRDNKKITG
jgi:predicted flap endonuclease-1-like 5' DNA nuclease